MRTERVCESLPLRLQALAAATAAFAAASAAARAEAVALDAVAATNRLREQVTKVTDAVDAVSKAVIRLDRSAADQGVVETAIQAAVDKALKPVLKAAKANGTEAAVIGGGKIGPTSAAI